MEQIDYNIKGIKLSRKTKYFFIILEYNLMVII